MSGNDGVPAVGVAALLTVLVNGFLLGGVYALIALGLQLAWGVTRVVNLAHGAMVVLGCYVAYQLWASSHLPPLLAIPVSLAVGFILGYALYRVLLHRLVESDVATLLATFGVSLVLYAFMLLIWGPDYLSIPWVVPSFSIGGVFIHGPKLVAFAVAAALIVASYLLLTRTGVGRALRAMAQDLHAARIVGIDPKRVGSIGFGIAVAFALAAGTALSFYVTFNPESGGWYTLLSFAVVALAGLQSVQALLLSAVIIAVLEQLATYLYNPQLGAAVPLIALMIALTIRPEGLLAGRRGRRRV